MIGKLSSKISDLLIRKSVIDSEDQELYVYGFFILLSQILYFIIAVIFGIIFNVLLQSVVFYIAFQFIRKYAGGYHASTEGRCEIMSTLSILACIVMIWLSRSYNFSLLLFCISLAAALIIALLCPLDAPEKPLSNKELKYFRKISWLILFIIAALIVVSYIFEWSYIFSPCCMSLILESILIIAGKIKQISNIKKMKSK
ncbi:MAG: accessory gene regulator ArgB-like protein [Eubacterium sp.]